MSGTTSAVRLKTLMALVQRQFGVDAYTQFASALHITSDDLKDETRLIPLERWHTALSLFEENWGGAPLKNLHEEYLQPNVMAAWARLLRGTQSPLEAYRHLPEFGASDVVLEYWQISEQSISLEKNILHARLPITHDVLYERSGLCGEVRLAELACIPELFGLPKAEVSLLRSDLEGDEPYLEYQVVWRGPPSRARLGLILSAVIVCGVSCFFLVSGALLGLIIALLTLIVGVNIAVFFYQNGQAERIAAGRRLMALERFSELKDIPTQKELSYGQGSVLAGQYRLRAPLGFGGSGAIYEAERLADHTWVAIKLLRAPIATDSVTADRFRREAAALSLVWHPNVVEVYDEGNLPDGTSYLVMERLYGQTLAERLLERAQLTRFEVQRIALELCDALEGIHAAGVIHRDLKPSNIFLCEDPLRPRSKQTLRIKVLDFGVARVEWAETRITQVGARLGTPGYMSPEQEQGEPIDPRSDLYAFGAILYECLTGIAPKPNSLELRASQAPNSSPEPSNPSAADAAEFLAQQLSLLDHPAWRELIQKMMAFMPNQRFPDARRLRDALLKLPEDALSPPIAGP